MPQPHKFESWPGHSECNVCGNVHGGLTEQRIRDGIAKLEDCILHHEIERDGWKPEDECYQGKVAEVVGDLLKVARQGVQVGGEALNLLRVTTEWEMGTCEGKATPHGKTAYCEKWHPGAEESGLRALLLEVKAAIEDLMADPSWVVLHNHGWQTLKAMPARIDAALAASEKEPRKEGR